MPKAGHDYDKAKAMLLKGLTLKQISDELRIPYATLQRHSCRHNWSTDQTRVRQVVAMTINEKLQAQCVQWVMSIAGKTEETLKALSNYDFAAKVHALKPLEWVNALDTLDRIARRNYGLDAEGNARPSITVNVGVLGSAQGAAWRDDVVDVETLKSASAEATGSTGATALSDSSV